MNVGRLRATLAELPDSMDDLEVMVRYEDYAARPVNDEQTGVDNDAFWIVAVDV